jgi:hypothetical protein
MDSISAILPPMNTSHDNPYPQLVREDLECLFIVDYKTGVCSLNGLVVFRIWCEVGQKCRPTFRAELNSYTKFTPVLRANHNIREDYLWYWIERFRNELIYIDRWDRTKEELEFIHRIEAMCVAVVCYDQVSESKFIGSNVSAYLVNCWRSTYAYTVC